MKGHNIVITKAKVHNLKQVNLSLSPHQLIVFTGVSGSGKSSLAFDTIYMEGQRRYIASLSTHARRHLGQFPAPEAEAISGISPTVAIEQKSAGTHPRSTVGTLTGIYDFLRVLFARISTPHCPISSEPLSPQNVQMIVETLLIQKCDQYLIFLAPLFLQKKGSLQEELFELHKKGFIRARVDGVIIDLSDPIDLDPNAAHDLDVVVDRIKIQEEHRMRIMEAVQTALDLSHGLLRTIEKDSKEEKLFSTHAWSPSSNLSYPPLEPQDFSFNHPKGMCTTCHGLGTSQEFSIERIIDPNKSLSQDCCAIASSFDTIHHGAIYRHLAKTHRINVHTPWKNLPKKFQDVFLYGLKDPWIRVPFSHPKRGNWKETIRWEGVLHEAKMRYTAAKSDVYKKNMQAYLQEIPCPICKGSRLKPYPSHARLQKKTLASITELSVEELLCFFQQLSLSPIEEKIAGELVKEIIHRLHFLQKVGLHYLSLDRPSPSLSGGEGQRVRLAAQIGSGLVGATYILDEPSIGLHAKDNARLLQTLCELRDKGNTVIVVEHDEETIAAADHIVDIGPLAGELGGRIVAQGTKEQILHAKESLTGKYLSKTLRMPPSRERATQTNKILSLQGATHHNLRHVSLSLPLGLFIAITGVSGSGKSSLIIDTLYPAVSNALHGSCLPVGPYKTLQGLEHIDKIIAIDQKPIGRTPRSNPSTYIKLFDEIRHLFSELPASQALGLSPGRFSFNTKEGTCSHCLGIGMIKIDMDFMADVWETCPICQGKRFDEMTLSIQFKGKSISDILAMTVTEALAFFSSHPKIHHTLQLLHRVGLEYITLGQPSPSLSGGEAQRIKLAKELSRPSTGKTLYILDEPTTGLHFHDIYNLLNVLQSLVDQGNTVCVIEHNLDFIAACDLVIDLGPEAGEQGGNILSSAPPLETANKNSATGLALHRHLFAAYAPPTLPQATQVPTHLRIIGATQNNLKGVSAQIPLGKITVCTGPSGSGKSSFAFETIYAEGQRRYTESMSHYAQQFIKQMQKPSFEWIDGLSAAIAIEQKKHAGNPRSTIGTMTEIYDYLRVIFSHMGTAFCPETGERIQSIDKQYIINKVLSLPSGSKCWILCPITLNKESFPSLQERWIRQGFLRIRLDNTFYELEAKIPYDPKKKHSLSLVIDRLILAPEHRIRIAEAIEQALSISHDRVIIATEQEDLSFSLSHTVQSTGKAYPSITPRTLSFNTEEGMCHDCHGLGIQYGAGPFLLDHLSHCTPIDLLFLLCKDFLSTSSTIWLSQELIKWGIDPDIPFHQMDPSSLQTFFQGSSMAHHQSSYAYHWRGIHAVLTHYAKSAQGNIRSLLATFLEETPCYSCQGTRLSPLARNVKISGYSINDLLSMNIHSLLQFITSLSKTDEQKNVLQEPFHQVLHRLHLMQQLGLHYLSLDRSAPTLSSGETQRVILSRQLGSDLSGCLYVLDEPTIGLHPHDNHLLNQALLQLKQLGNTIILVEHDPLTMQIADHIIDFGPGAGKLGGTITASGSLQQILSNPASLTGAYLSKNKQVSLPSRRRNIKHTLHFPSFSKHNICDLTLQLPTQALVCITGVSGAGKSTLLFDLIRKHVVEKKNKKQSDLIGYFDQIITFEQNPIGTTRRADINTYTGLLTHLRYLYASLSEAKARGLQPKHFSYNHKKGMCLVCQGLGTKTIPLHFLPSVQVECEACHGFRLHPLALSVSFKGKHLGEVLSLSITEAKQFFHAFPKIVKILDSLLLVGLSYLQVGQDIASLSGGEAQRLRLSCELAKRAYGKTLYLLDEPSIGLHSSDIAIIVPILHSLVDKGHTVVFIEHNLDLIAQADYIIDMGPGAGPEGGKIVAMGTPEEISRCSYSKTGIFLQKNYGNVNK